MSLKFKGRPILAGEAVGEAVVTHAGFNSLSSFYKSMLTDADTAVCNDQDNREIFGVDLTGKIICLPKSIGSTSAGATWDRVAQMGIAPKAMLFSQQIDSLAAAGLVLAEVWVGRRIYTIDQLGDEFLNQVQTGQRIEIHENGTVIVD
jgi:predicted aconitase with swiveling domain